MHASLPVPPQRFLDMLQQAAEERGLMDLYDEL